MAIIAEDVIATAGADTDINGRTLTSGGTWQPRLNASANINIVDSTPDYFTGSSTSQTCTYKDSNISSTYDDEVISPAMRITTLAQSSQGVVLGITGTQAGADKKWYAFYIDPGTGDFRINKLIEASAIDFSTSVSQATAGFTVSTGVDYEMKIRRIDNGDGTHTLKGFMDGTEVISWTDDGVTNGALLDMGAGGLRTRAGGRHYGYLHQTWAASGAMVGAASITITDSGTIVGRGALAGSAAQSLTPSGTLSGRAALNGSLSVGVAPSATLRGIGALSGSQAISFSLSGSMFSSAMRGSTAMSLDLSGTLGARVSVSGSAGLSMSFSGTLTGVSISYYQLTPASTPETVDLVAEALPASVTLTPATPPATWAIN